MTVSTHIFTDPRCLLHDTPGYPERPDRLHNILQTLRARASERGWGLQETCSHPQARERVEQVHDPAYVERFERAVERGDSLLDSADNPLCPHTWEAAWGAVETALSAADMCAANRCAADTTPEAPPRHAFAAVRPPGHHAEKALAMGFCFFNNAAVAAEHLRRQHGLQRIAIFDFDVHHGNGTQHLFENRGDVFYASTHQHPFYPGTGLAEERGRGDGVGTTLNVPLRAGDGDEAFFEALDERILPGLEAFAPEALILSAGFDAWDEDPLGGLRVSLDAFEQLGYAVAKLARQTCSGRLLSVLEGGYDVARLPDLVCRYLDGCSTGLQGN